MSSNVCLEREDESTRTEDRPTSRTSDRSESSLVTTSAQESGGQFSSSDVHRTGRKPLVIDCPDEAWCLAFLDGEHLVSGDSDGKIQYWRVADGSEVGAPMDTGSPVYSIAVSRDGRWIVSGTESGMVQVWNAETRGKAQEIRGHSDVVLAVDVSPDATRITSGSDDETVCVWSLSSGDRLLGPWEHEHEVAAAKFSPGGRLVATATWRRDSVRVYDEEGRRLFDLAIRVNSPQNNSLAWSGDGVRLFALSDDGDIHSLDALTGSTLARWAIHSTQDAECIALARDGTFVAASASPSVSLWDTTTQQQIGSVVQFNHPVWCLAISDERDLAAGGESMISIHNLGDIPPLSYTRDVPKIGIQPSELEDEAHGEGQEEDIDTNSVPSEKTLEQRCELGDAQRTTKELPDGIAQLKTINENLRRDLAQSRRAVDEQKAQTESWRTKSNGEITQLKETIDKLNRDLAESHRAVDEQKAQTESWKTETNDEIMRLRQSNDKLHNDLVVSSSKMSENQEKQERETEALQSKFEQKQASLHDEIAQLKRANEGLQSVVHMHKQRCQCEALYALGRMFDVAKLLFEIGNTAGECLKGDKFLSDWLAESMSRCSESLERNGDDASNAGKLEEAVAAYVAVLSLGSSNPPAVLAKWASAALTNCPAREVLHASVMLKASRFAVYRAVCNVLEDLGRISEALETLRDMQDDLRDTGTSCERMQWERDFQERCAGKLVTLGDTARHSKNHEEAIRYYSDAMSLDPTNLNEVLLKRGNELIELSPSSHKGYEEKHVALHGMGRYSEAFGAFQAMLSTLKRSRDPEICELRNRYVDATSAIRNEVWEAIRHLPTVLIDTDTGRLYNKTRQAAAFEELPIYDELRSSMTMTLDHSRIQNEVKKFYRYVMFSHKWQLEEPTFQQVNEDSVYNLPSSPIFDKLRNFCKLVVALQFKWAWTDTCCVNQLDKGVQQESIVAMFRWYRCSSLTVVHLLGVLSESQEVGCLWKSIWNTRGWTYQEYVASDVVQFYTEDWKPYLDLQVFNHKESPVVLSEMEHATNVTSRQLIILQPGLDRAREKLYLASGRQTAREEDMAHSLFGIFGVALPVVYGEGNLAIGRLLEHILTRSDEVTLLAWTGLSGSHHSYLPASLTVYNEIVLPHVPTPVETSKMDRMVFSLRSSILDLSLVIDLYERLYDLPPLSVLAGRLKLPGIVFRLDELSSPSESDLVESNVRVYRTTTPLLGDVEIQTATDLGETSDLCLIHPWISPLIDQDFSRGKALFDLPTRALRLLVRLRQPFGGLLLSLSAREQYRRVATDSLIMVRVREEAPLSELLDAVRTVQIQ